jgi:hypothetical protein
VWLNCCLYNAAGSDFNDLGLSFSRRFEADLEKVKRSGSASEWEEIEGECVEALREWNPNAAADKTKSKASASAASSTTEPSLEMKQKFSANLFKISGDELGHVIQIVEQRCPVALGMVVVNGGQPGAAGNGAASNGEDRATTPPNGNGSSSSASSNPNATSTTTMPPTFYDPEPSLELNVDLVDTQTFHECSDFMVTQIARRQEGSRSGGGKGGDDVLESKKRETRWRATTSDKKVKR